MIRGMRALTCKQRRIYDFIAESVRTRGVPPTLREIMVHAGIRSTNGATQHVDALIRKGWVRKEAMRSRALTLLGPPLELPSETRDVIEGLVPAMHEKGFRLVRTF